MVAVGKISIDLIANTAKLTKGLGKAAGEIKMFAKVARVAAISAVAGVAGAVVGAVSTAIYSTIGRTKKAFQELGEISDESKRLGIPAEQLSGLQFAAKQAGMDVTALGRSLTYMMKQGRSVQDLEKIADELEKMPSQVQKMQFVIKTFGRGSAPMLNVLEGGSKQLRKMIELSRRLGYQVSQKQADAVEKAGDAWERIGLAMDGIGRKIAVALAPNIDFLASKIVVLIGAFEGLGKVAGSVLDYIGQMTLWLADIYDRLSVTMKGWEISLTLVLNPIESFDPNSAAFKRIRKLMDEIDAWYEKPAMSAALRRDWARSRREFLDELDAFRKGPAAPGSVAAAGTSAEMGIGPAERGSQEAFRAIYEATGLGKSKDLNERMLEAEEEAADALGRIEASIRNNGLAVAGLV